MKKVLLLLLVTSLSYGQSFFDTSIAGGLSKEQTALGGIELRYNQEVLKGIYASVSGNFLLTTDKQGGLDGITLYPRVGAMLRLNEGLTLTGGGSIEANNIGFWPEPYARIDQRVWSNDQGSISTMIDIQTNRIMIGIVFTNNKI